MYHGNKWKFAPGPIIQTLCAHSTPKDTTLFTVLFVLYLSFEVNHFHIWQEKKKKKRKQPVLLNLLSPHFCIGKFTEWFSNDSSYCDYTFAGQILGFLCPLKPNKAYRDGVLRKQNGGFNSQPRSGKHSRLSLKNCAPTTPSMRNLGACVR